jgi:hypothetical protein
MGESNHVDTRCKIGEISYDESEKKKNIIRKKYSKVEQEVVELDRLLMTSKSSEVGGSITIDVYKDVDHDGNINRKMSASSVLNDIKSSNVDIFSKFKFRK